MIQSNGLKLVGGGLGLGAIALAFTFLRPYWVLAIAARLSPDVTFFMDTDRPNIALTIDDAPDPVTTEQILDVLDRHDARATFFLMGEAAREHQAIVDRIVADGHELGNHTMRDEPSIRLSPEPLQTSIQQTHDILSQSGPVKWFRPGSGWYSNAMLDVARQQRYRTALGSAFPFDTHVHSSRFATWYVLGNARPGTIIVLHDGGDRGERTVATLEKLLPALQEQGYRVMSLSQLGDSV